MTLPDTQEAQDFAVAQVTLPDAAGVGLPAYPRPDLVTPSVSAAAPAPAKADVGAVQKEPVSSEELIPFEQGGRPCLFLLRRSSFLLSKVLGHVSSTCSGKASVQNICFQMVRDG